MLRVQWELGGRVDQTHAPILPPEAELTEIAHRTMPSRFLKNKPLGGGRW